ncbi:uncharacterized protein LOC132283518 isoform X2 [Cornus florida]|uniref:uncharacterized protein LOC132283518 isoform X2 n=1 Tax=Cornus florida TaxID=4283 RepID=UPI00289BCFE3|nr:uncharacterized protein LOC132283518 isoform X2 [Cornus florida]
MQVLPRWRYVLILKNSFTPSPSTSTSSTHLASFHSTPITFEKWKSKWKSSYIKYATREKRADAKKALKDLLYNYGSTTFPFQGDDTWGANGTNSWDASEADLSDSYRKEAKANSSARRSRRSQLRRMKRKIKRAEFYGDYNEHPEKCFKAKFGSRCYTWSYSQWEGHSFDSSASGFEWRDDSNRTNSRSKEWKNPSDTESDDDCTVVGSCSDRTILGLPPRGPLKIEDVKNAFRLSALKWHPDKHQGPSQAMAEEKFKICANAYKSLCNAFSSV